MAYTSIDIKMTDSEGGFLSIQGTHTIFKEFLAMMIRPGGVEYMAKEYVDQEWVNNQAGSALLHLRAFTRDGYVMTKEQVEELEGILKTQRHWRGIGTSSISKESM